MGPDPRIISLGVIITIINWLINQVVDGIAYLTRNNIIMSILMGIVRYSFTIIFPVVVSTVVYYSLVCEAEDITVDEYD